MTIRSLTRPRVAASAAALAALSLAAACSSSSSGGVTPTGNESSAPASGTPSDPQLAKVYKGTLSSPDTASRPGAKGKNIWIISGGQSSESSKVPVDAAEEAAKKLGWKVHVYDTQLNPAN